MTDQRSNAGGAAMGGGAEYQARLAAWLGTYLLAETDAQPPLELTSAVAAIACETAEAVDDLLVRTVAGHTAYLQAKRKIALDRRRKTTDGSLTPLPSAIDQFVRQYLLQRERARTSGAPMLDPVHDRLVLVVGQRSSSKIRETLADVLDRIRIQPATEPLISPVLNQQERQALEAFISHARDSWEQVAGSTPDDAELREFMRLVHIETIAVEDGEPGEEAALTLLRQSVLEDPNDARQAWSALIKAGSHLIRTRSGVAGSELRGILLREGIRLRAPRSYREDIERLRRHTAAVVARLEEYASIPLKTERVEIDRPYAEVLREAAESGPTLVVGEPGAGKSGVMHGLAQILVEEGRDVVVLAAQDPPFSSVPELRDALRLEHDVADVLAHWPGDEPAFLLIDALDAARTDAAAQALRQLIAQVGDNAERWRVIASVREYDARYGRELQRLFRGAPPAGPSSSLPGTSFRHVRHLVIGRLTEPELSQLASKSPPLRALLITAPPALAHLLHNPFNLRLAAELLDMGTEPEAIRAVQSQLDLLDLYWGERVLGGGDAREAHARESVLANTVRAMVRDRSLRVDTQSIGDDPAASPALADLLSAHVLTEWSPAPGRTPDRYTLTFAHHILFDYAVERLLLRRSLNHVVALLASDPALVLLARPSLVMHFHHLWGLDPDGSHREFWEAALAISSSAGIPEIGKLIGPSVAAGLTRNLSDLAPLLEALESGDGRAREAAANVYYHLVRSVPSAKGDAIAAADDRTALWCAVLERVSKSFFDGTAYPARTLLWDLTSRADDLPPEQLSDIGSASRRLLEFAWRREPRDRHLVVHGLQYVCRTFASDPAASGTLLRRAIEPEHLAVFGSEELHWIANQVEQLVLQDPGFVRDLYVAAFSYREESDEPSPMGGIVLRLISNRRQDYDGALYALARAYPAFLAAAPEHAVSALNPALEARVARERIPGEDRDEAAFDVEGVRASILADYSFIWDRGAAYPGEYAVELLDHLENRLARLAGPDGDLEPLNRLLRSIIQEARLAVVWRRLLLLGARHPETLGIALKPLAWAAPVLTGLDTSAAAGELIRAVVPHLSIEDRERVERAILSIPDGAPAERREQVERTRDRLLGCLGAVEPVTAEARDRLMALRAADAVPPNEEDRPSFDVHSRTFGEEEYLAKQGIPVHEAPNGRIRELEAPVAQFASEHMNSVPETAAVEAVLPHLRALREALRSAEADGVHPKQADYAWGVLAEACAAVAKDKESGCEELAAFTREVLLEASRHPDPVPEPDADLTFVDPHWSTPAVRIDAAKGLITLAISLRCLDDDVLAALDRLMDDPVPAVRYQLAVRLHGLYSQTPRRCSTMIEHMAARERSPGVLLGLVQHPLFALRFADPDRVAGLVISIYNRASEEPGAQKLRNACVDVLANLHLIRGHEPSTTVVQEIASRPLDHLEEASHLVHHFREVLVVGPADGSDSAAEGRRRRALDFVLQVTRPVARAFREGVEAARTTESGVQATAHSEEQLRALAHLLDRVGWNLYFVSGACEGEEKGAPDPAVQARLLREAGPIMDELADVGLASLTHHLLEALEALIPSDPRGVFMRIAAVIRGGRKGHYQYDQMAEKVLVRVVERYLADHRPIFQEDEEARRSLIEILDTFVRAGSEGARRLSYGLDGIFR